MLEIERVVILEAAVDPVVRFDQHLGVRLLDRLDDFQHPLGVLLTGQRHRMAMCGVIAPRHLLDPTPRP